MSSFDGIKTLTVAKKETNKREGARGIRVGAKGRGGSLVDRVARRGKALCAKRE